MAEEFEKNKAGHYFDGDSDNIVFKRKSQFPDFWRRFCKNRLAVFGLFISCIIIFTAVFADVIVPYEQGITQNTIEKRYPPSAEHILGTDTYGRDIFARIVHGARNTFAMALLSVGISVVVGGILGAIAGYFGGLVDSIITRVIDTIMCMPFMLLALAMIAAMGHGVVKIAIALTVALIPSFTRLVRASILNLNGAEFIEAAKACGTPNWMIVFKHVLPNAMGILIVQATMSVGAVIIASAGLSYLGMGITPPAPDWGFMLYEAKPYYRYAPFLIIVPGLAIVMSALSLNLLGDGLRDALDPRLKD